MKNISHPKLTILLLTAMLCAMRTQVYGDGLPGEYVLTDRWRCFHGSHSPVANPAFLTDANYLSLRGVFTPVLQNAFRLLEVGVTVPVGFYQSAGLTILGEDGGQIRGGSIDGSGNVLPLDMQEGNRNALLLGSYAVNPWNRLSAGVNVAVAYQSNFGEPRWGVGLDIGATYRIINHPAFGYHLLGLATQNLIAPSMTSRFTLDFTSRNQYARNLKISWIAAFFERRIDIGLDVNLKDFFSNAELFRSVDPSDQGQLSQAAQRLEFDCNFRMGVWLARMIRLATVVGIGENSDRHLGIAMGVNIPSVNGGRDLEALYQYTNMFHGAEASSHSMYLRSEVGKHREELYARKLALGLDLSPNELYNKACRLYHAGNYWDAFFVFGQILTLFPDFFKNDWVSYYMGSCQEKMDMRYSGRKRLERIREEYPQSEAVHYAELGLMRIGYRENDVLAVSRSFQKLFQITVPDSLKFHACYLMAETNMRQQEYTKAIQFFAAIPPTHPQYVFAQHSLAICHIIRGENEKAKEALDRVVTADVRTAAQKEIVNRSYLLAGYLYYEEQTLSKAVAALRKVPSTSYYYEDALLGLAWAALRARQWGDCVAAAQALQNVSKKPIIVCEAILLEAFPSIVSKDYSYAARLLQKATERLASIRPPSEDTMALRTQLYQTERYSYEEIGNAIDDLSDESQSTMGMRMIDSLHVQQVKIKASIDDFLCYKDEFGRLVFFSKNLDNLKADINYLLATVEKLRAQLPAESAKQFQEQKQLDEEIKKLKEQMKKMEERKQEK